MLSFVLAIVAGQGALPVERDAYGVPHVYAPTWDEAFFHAGFSVAEDRLWQMENSRRVARGRMAEAFGAQFAASDREVLRFGYTDEELGKQLAGLSSRVRSAFDAYARGVNAYIEQASKAGKLPEGYEKGGLSHEPWTVLDSAAIAVRTLQLFGRRDPGEIRNWVVYQYLQTQPAKDRALDVLDDFVWHNDPRSPTTIRPEDEPPASVNPRFPKPARSVTVSHLAALPKLTMLDLLPAVRIGMGDETRRIAQAVGAPFKGGSYAAVVGKGRSATGTPLLLSAPQMGHFAPSVVHELSISAPGVAAAGMDIPGVPGIAIGYTPRVGWALTSGVADTDDVFYFPAEGEDGYKYGSESRKLEVIRRTLKTKGRPDETVEARRTHAGPVVLSSKGYVFSRRSASWMRELESLDAMFSLFDVKTPEDLERALSRATMNFNILYAFSDGAVGWRFLGYIPQRAEGFDPRFPLPGVPEAEWKGWIPFAQMPRSENPKSGLVYNWNNKPAPWWPNWDTPAWGRTFRVEALARSLDKPKLSIQDLEIAAWTIARTDFTVPHFLPFVQPALSGEIGRELGDAAKYLASYDGRRVAGSQGATIYGAFVDELRKELFSQHVGSFFNPDLFRMAAQPSVMLNALGGTTELSYLGTRSARDVVRTAFEKAVQDLARRRGEDSALWTHDPGGIAVPDEPPIPYGDRGTYIQLLEMRTVPRGRNVLPPGVAETGPHSRDQAPLARAWMYKPMRIRPSGVSPSR